MRTLYVIPLLVLALLACSKDDDAPVPQPQPTPVAQGLVDIDGNTYDTVAIGGVTWMAENLRVRRYRNGDSIPYMPEAADWSMPGSNAYCMFGNSITSEADHGFLYGFGAVADVRGICPEGWHIPTDAEWGQLELALGMPVSQLDSLAPGGYGSLRGEAQNVGGKLKALLTWDPPNTGATNAIGFEARASGQRSMPGSSYVDLGTVATFWSSTSALSEGWVRRLDHDNGGVWRYHHGMGSDQPGYGHSCRCVRD